MLVVIGALLSGLAPPLHAIAQNERGLLLDAVRPGAAALAAEPVRIKVDRLNVDGGWAVLVGRLVGVGQAEIAWSKAEGREPELDKMLWAVLQEEWGRWVVRHIERCAAEPPYWYLEQHGGFVWPCGVYAGPQAAGRRPLDQQCRRQTRKPSARAAGAGSEAVRMTRPRAKEVIDVVDTIWPKHPRVAEVRELCSTGSNPRRPAAGCARH